jgi:hypothetical protein
MRMNFWQIDLLVSKMMKGAATKSNKTNNTKVSRHDFINVRKGRVAPVIYRQQSCEA